MKKYETPEIIVTNLEIDNVIAAQFTESGGDNNADWISSWTSAVQG